MRSSIKLIILVPFLFVLQSCFDLGFYASKIPIGKLSTAKIDYRLVATWEKDMGELPISESEFIEFVPFNDREYVVCTPEPGGVNLARAFIVKIGNLSFLNIQDLSDSEKNYVFCRYEISEKGELILDFVTDTLFEKIKPRSSRKLNKFIKKNLNNPKLFDMEMRFVLTKKKK